MSVRRVILASVSSAFLAACVAASGPAFATSEKPNEIIAQQAYEALAAGDLALAARLLGRPYSISGRVVGGYKLGKKIGFPTANIQLKHNKPPVRGIFVVQVRGLGDRPLPGVASLGTRPTLHADGKPTLEVHLFDFIRDIYGTHLRVDFLAKLREEEKYPDLGTLTRQIGRDVENAKAFFTARDARDAR